MIIVWLIIGVILLYIGICLSESKEEDTYMTGGAIFIISIEILCLCGSIIAAMVATGTGI